MNEQGEMRLDIIEIENNQSWVKKIQFLFKNPQHVFITIQSLFLQNKKLIKQMALSTFFSLFIAIAAALFSVYDYKLSRKEATTTTAENERNHRSIITTQNHIQSISIDVKELERKIGGIFSDQNTQKHQKINILSEMLELRETTIEDTLRAFGEEGIPHKDWAKLLLEKAAAFERLERELATFKPDSLQNQEMFNKAKAAIGNEHLAKARTLLLQLEYSVANVVTLSAQSKAMRAETYMAEWAYGDAAKLFELAAMMVEDDNIDLYRGYLWSAANAYYEEGTIRTGNTTLYKSIELFEVLSNIYRRKDNLVWAALQVNIGNVLLTLGKKTGDDSVLQDAKGAYSNALEIYSEKGTPLDWAAIQLNLGNVLLTLGKKTGDDSVLQDAKGAYSNALEIYSKSHTPMEWASAQHGIGAVLSMIGYKTRDDNVLKDAKEAYSNALEIYSEEGTPVQWAKVQYGLGTLLLIMGHKTKDDEILNDALAAYEKSLPILDEMGAIESVKKVKRMIKTIQTSL